MKSMQNLLNDWQNATRNMQKLGNDIPRIFGNEGVKVSKANFQLQGYDSGTGVKSWPARSETTNKRYDKRSGVKGSVYQSGNPLLTQTRDLYNAIKYYLQGKRVTVGVDLSLIPYARKMNEGGPGTWGKNATNTPARPFITTDGPNVKVLKAAGKKIESERNKALKEFKK